MFNSLLPKSRQNVRYSRITNEEIMNKQENSFKNDVATVERYVLIASAIGTATAIVLLAYTVWVFS